MAWLRAMEAAESFPITTLSDCLGAFSGNATKGGTILTPTIVSGISVRMTANYSTPAGNFKVDVSTDGNAWTTVATFSPNTSSFDTGLVSLASYIGNRVYIRAVIEKTGVNPVGSIITAQVGPLS
jgi:hypothetical protein